LGRTANAFYIETVPAKGEWKETYVAYVPAQDWLHIPMVDLKAKAILGLGTTSANYGHLYYSVVRSYQKDGKTKEGFMTFLIPFQYDADRQTAYDLQAPEDACNVRTIQQMSEGQQPYPTGANCQTLPAFLGYFGQYLWTTNIPMLKDGVTMRSNDVESLAKTLVKLCDSSVKRVLKRSDTYFSVIGKGVNALVHKKENFVDAAENSKADPWNVTLEMVVPYTNVNNYNIVSKILQCVMNACAQRVAKTEYQGAMLVFLGRSGDTWTSTDTQKYYKSLWLSSVWLLVTELCRGEMTPKRISKLSYSLFGDYMKVYQKAGNFPDTETWEKYQEDFAASKGHNPPTSLEHFAGVDIQPNIAQLQPGTPGTPGTPGVAAAKRRAGSMNHIIPPATPLSPGVPNTPNSAATMSIADRRRIFLLNMRRESSNLIEMKAFEEFQTQFEHAPNEQELTLYVHLMSISPTLPTADEFRAYNVLYVQLGSQYPEAQQFLEFYDNWKREKARRAAETEAELEDVTMGANIIAARDW
jgi:hypothetical protein